MTFAILILAHDGAIGWDEVAIVVGPLVLMVGALWMANRWARNRDELD